MFEKKFFNIDTNRKFILFKNNSQSNNIFEIYHVLVYF